MSQEVQMLVECEDKTVAAKADEVMMLTSAYEEGQISREEYVELLEDIKRTVEVEEEGSDIQFKANLIKGISGILQVV